MDERVQDFWFGFVRSFDEAADQQNDSKSWSLFYQTVSAAAAAIVILFVIFTFFFRGVGVVGASMEPTLHEGDVLAVASLPNAKTGDIVIVSAKTNSATEKTLVKRVIAKGGDTVNIDFLSGVITVNDKIREESFKADPISVKGDVEFPYTVPQGCYFVLGDNRNNSMDSRFSVIGDIDDDYVMGVVKMRIFPFSAIEIL